MNPESMISRVVDAMNTHDLDALLRCFHPEYESEQPAHPNRNFRGRENVAANWGWVFERFDDFRVELLNYAVRGSSLWTEWRWFGTDPDRREVEVRGVMILELEDGLIRAGRLYMEPVNGA